MSNCRSRASLATVLLLLSVSLGAETIVGAEAQYFPESDADWESVDPAGIGWDADKLSDALTIAGQRKSSGVVILQGGRILAECYWDDPDDTSRYSNMLTGRDLRGWAIEDVASAQKSVVALLTGIAQERGYLQLDDAVTQYLGPGWSKLPVEREGLVSIRHLLSMSSGLATDFSFAAEPGVKWLYNTPVYHALMRVLVAATGMDRQTLTQSWLSEPLGLTHTSWTDRPWANSDIAVGLSTTARELARLGLMIMADGEWAGEKVIGDRAYLAAMLSPSQQLNPSYGYLWWLNGQEFSRAATSTARRIEGQLIPEAPEDLVAMQGALDRKLYLVPSLDIVVARLGSNGAAGGRSFNSAFWEALMDAVPDPTI